MMSKTTIWVIVGVVLLGAGYLALRSNNAPLNEQQEVQAGVPNNAGGEQATTGKKIAFSELVKKQDGAYKCTVTQHVGEMSSEGVAYINGGMVRGEFNTKVQGMNVDSSFIVRDGMSYTWTSMLPNMGFKSAVTADTTMDNNAGTSGSYSFNYNQIGDYNCEAWTADQSQFEIPASITFKEMSSASVSN